MVDLIQNRLTVAAVQMPAKPGALADNLARAERLVSEAFTQGAQWVALPEFFACGMAFDPVMHNVAVAVDGPVLAFLRDAARRHSGYVGGSSIVASGVDRHNTYFVVAPDGTFVTHDKDIPTFWEGCYYAAGNDDGVGELGGYRVGCAVCFEFIRFQTARRLQRRIDFLIGGSGWWGMPKVPLLGARLAAMDMELPRFRGRVVS